jgi:hypothetical protein
MNERLRCVDSDRHVLEPPALFDRYLDPTFKHRASVPVGTGGRRAARRGRLDRERLSVRDMMFAASRSGSLDRRDDGGDSWRTLGRAFGEVSSILWGPRS